MVVIVGTFDVDLDGVLEVERVPTAVLTDEYEEVVNQVESMGDCCVVSERTILVDILASSSLRRGL